MKLKSLIKYPWVRTLLCRIAYGYILLCIYTTRWRYEGKDEFIGHLQGDRPVIIAFWHGRIMLMPHIWPKSAPEAHLLVSQHNDGELLSRILSYFGFKLIRGSTNRGGASALKHMLRVLKSGNPIAITPDGPRGPAQKINGALTEIAVKTRAVIIPVSVATNRFHAINSWDKFRLALPFTRGTFIYGKGLTLDTYDAETDTLREILEKAINDVSKQSDELYNI